MNAHALLTSQGWRGSGHSLHPTSDTTGLSRPLLVSQKQNVLGIGKKQHKTSDMWWMNAFDKSLKGLDTSEEGKVVQTMTSGGLDMVARGGGKWAGNGGGLYGSFVRGEVLGGTLTPEEKSEPSATATPEPVKERRREGESKEERRRRKELKRARRVKGEIEASEAVESVPEEEVEITETKEQRKDRRRLKKLAKQSTEQSAPEVLSANDEENRREKKKKQGKD